MKNIQLNKTNKSVIDSREVAEMIGKRHCDLLTDIDGRKDGSRVGIIPTLKKDNILVEDFFIKTTYSVGNRGYKCYLITRQGCDIIFNKQKKSKRNLFAAEYVKRFNQIEEEIRGVQENKLGICPVVSIKELQANKHQKDKAYYSVRNFGDIIRNSSSITLDKDMQNIISFHTNLAPQERYKCYRDLEKVEYINRIKLLIINKLNYVAYWKYSPSKVVSMIEINLRLHKEVLEYVNRCNKAYIVQLKNMTKSVDKFRELVLSI